MPVPRPQVPRVCTEFLDHFGRSDRAADFVVFAEWCGFSLARSHARSGDASVIAGYLGESDTFDKAIASFAKAYADQTERDHAALKKAARKGSVQVFLERRYHYPTWYHVG